MCVTVCSCTVALHLHKQAVGWPPDAGETCWLFIIRVKRELKRVYRNGCRYNESGLAAGNCRPGQTLKTPKYLRSFVYYESMKRKLKINPIYECRYNGRLQTKRFTRLSHTGLVVELEHLKIKTRLTNEKFASVKGECEI